jgi:FkbM family methyltransferase
MARLRHHPTLRRARRRLLLLRRTGAWRPGSIVLAASGRTIHVDPRDPRGWEIVRGLGRGHQPALIALWRRAVEHQGPDLVVDVGANYGELLLSGDYPPTAAVVAVEPNPTVASLLRRSIAEHPHAASMRLEEVIASDRDDGTATLHIDPAWSGSASVALAGAGRSGRALEQVEVPVRTLDALTADAPDGASLLLKVDAEGWEAAVLAGATGLLERAGAVTALIEFDPDHLRRAGADPAALFATLASVGRCWAVAHDGTATPIDRPPAAPCDVLVASDPELAEAVLAGPAGPAATDPG